MRIISVFTTVLLLLGTFAVRGQSNPSFTTRYEYDSVGRLVRVLYPDSTETWYRYDRRGNLLSVETTGTNSAPVSASAAIVTDEDTPSAPVAPLVDDPDDGDTHTISILTQPARGTASLMGNDLVYTPELNFYGSDSFTFRATDRGGLSVDGQASVTVRPVNDAPKAVSDIVSTAEDTPKPIAPLDNDSDIENDPLSISGVGPAGNGTATRSGDTITYTPKENFNGQDSFPYVVSDGNGGLDTALVRITVTPVNDAPDRFSRLLPADDDTLQNRIVRFLWTAAPDADNDPVGYTLRIATGGSSTSYATADTTFVLDFAPLGVPAAGDTVRWSLEASDGALTTLPSNGDGRFTFTVLTSVREPGPVLPAGYALEQNYPNPFHPGTTIVYSLPRPGFVSVKIYALNGRHLATLRSSWHEAGRHAVTWDAPSLPNGTYLYQLEAGGSRWTRFMTLLR